MCLKRKKNTHTQSNLRDTVYNVNKSLLILYPFTLLKKTFTCNDSQPDAGQDNAFPDLINSHS